MTDTLPPPPAEITVDLKPGEAEYLAQGGRDFNFWYKSTESGDAYIKTDVSTHEYLRNVYYKNMQKVSIFENTLKEAVSQGEIDPDIAGEFAAIFGFTLKRSYEFTATVEYTFTVELGYDDDPDCVVDNLNFDLSEGWNIDYELDNVDSNITYSDYTEV